MTEANANIAVQQHKDFIVVEPTIDARMAIAETISKSQFCPPSFRNKPSDVMMAMWHGDSLGLSPLQSVQSIAVINSRPSLWGDALLAICRSSKLCVSIKEEQPTSQNGMTATCTVERSGEKYPIVRTFSEADARQARLWGKTGPWTTNPKRMLQLRARAFALRDAFPDLLNGLASAEEAQDFEPIESTPAEVVSKPMPKRKAKAKQEHQPEVVDVQPVETVEPTVVEPEQPQAQEKPVEEVYQEKPVEESPKEQPVEAEETKDTALTEEERLAILNIENAKTMDEIKVLWGSVNTKFRVAESPVYKKFVEVSARIRGQAK